MVVDVVNVDNVDCNEDVCDSDTVIISVSSVLDVVGTLERIEVVKVSEVWLDNSVMVVV